MGFGARAYRFRAYGLGPQGFSRDSRDSRVHTA